jgi:hypothetical protein
MCLATLTTELAPVPSVCKISSWSYVIVGSCSVTVPSGRAEMPADEMEKPPFENVPVAESENPSARGLASTASGASGTAAKRAALRGSAILT